MPLSSEIWRLATRLKCSTLTLVCLWFLSTPPQMLPSLHPQKMQDLSWKKIKECPPHLWAINGVPTPTCCRARRTPLSWLLESLELTRLRTPRESSPSLPWWQLTQVWKWKRRSLEDQFVATDPNLESYGNAVRQWTDSSRVGNFMKIYFTASVKLAGWDIVSYLLATSHITEKQEVERSFPHLQPTPRTL